jgi:copper chaperone CopZ
VVTSKTINFKNMHNVNDAKRVSDILHDVWGVRDVDIYPDNGMATISFDEDASSYQDFQQALREGGFEFNNESD